MAQSKINLADLGAADFLNTSGGFTREFRSKSTNSNLSEQFQTLTIQEKEKLFELYKNLQNNAAKINWNLSLSNFCAPKPIERIDEVLHQDIYDRGAALYPRKYDGVGGIARHEENGWKIYTLDNIDITDSLGHVVTALSKVRSWGVGTMLHGELAAFFEGPGLGEKRGSASGYLFAKEEKQKSGLKDGDYVLPTFVVFDILFANKVDLGFLSYQERVCLYDQQLPAATQSSSPLVKAEFYNKTNPNNWRENLERDQFEGLILIDKNIRPGLVWSTKKSHKRPKGKWKLKLNIEEDVVIYAVHCHEDGVPRSVFIKQIDPKTKKWFQCGKISVSNRRAVIEGLTPYLDKALPIIATNKDLKDPQIAKSLAEKSIDIRRIEGIVVNAEALQRFPTGKFDAPKFVTEKDGNQEILRIRKSKKISDCYAQYLPEGKDLDLSFI